MGEKCPSVSSYKEAQTLPVRPHLKDICVTLNPVSVSGSSQAVPGTGLTNDFSLPRNQSISSIQSTVSDVSHMLWSIDDLSANAHPAFVARSFLNDQGGTLKIQGTGVSLTVPPGAIPRGRVEGVYIALMKGNERSPALNGRQSLLSPIVMCGPNGIKFKKPVLLSIPHCALLEHKGAWNLQGMCNPLVTLYRLICIKVAANQNSYYVPIDFMSSAIRKSLLNKLEYQCQKQHEYLQYR